MFSPGHILASAFAEHLAEGYCEVFGRRQPDHAPVIRTMAKLAIERIAGSDALYHDAGHTIVVTLVGQAILRGRILREAVTPEDWMHFTLATLLHDVGYLRGVCPGDRREQFVIDAAGELVTPPRGASDAYLAPWHIERGKIFVRHRCTAVEHLDPERLCRAIELTRFPVPEDGDHADTAGEAGLVRAADLIGQLADPDHSRKIASLFHEFSEIGLAAQLGYASPADVAERYPHFFWEKVEPFIGAAIEHLERTVEGRLWVALLYAHVFVEEHARARPGPSRGGNG